ncbi:MAG: exodeoxyribonuclease VII large subunit [Kiritimatiellae bacterium]|nr:exodeoxyribonuclease VII large subunit [Kiritimatiellia bacterium]
MNSTPVAHKCYSVAQVTQAMQKCVAGLQREKGPYWVQGEIGDWRPYGRGDIYFTLKDADGSTILNCVAWAGIVAKSSPATREYIKDPAKNTGLKLRVRGLVKIIPSKGSYRFEANEIALADGMGELMQRFLALKEKLAAEGLFAHSANPRKWPVPVRRLGIVTSETGAVVHDICVTAIRRFPDIHIRLFPAKVQGAGAAEDVARGIAYFNACKDWRPEVIIVGRGGGSMEELWAFNEEVLVRAVAASAIPVISAVGHQTDFTLCDFAADARAGTPSIAAERAVAQKIEIAERIRRCESLVQHSFKQAYAEAKWRFKAAAQRLAAAPGQVLADFEKRLAAAKAALPHTLANAFVKTENRIRTLDMRLTPVTDAAITNAEHRLAAIAQKLALLDPRATLKRGYSITFGADGKVVLRADAVAHGDTIRTMTADGVIASRVEKQES